MPAPGMCESRTKERFVEQLAVLENGCPGTLPLPSDGVPVHLLVWKLCGALSRNFDRRRHMAGFDFI